MKLSASVLRSLRSPTRTAIKVSRAFRSAGSKSAIHSYHPEEEKESDNSQLGERASIKQEIETGVAIAAAFSSTTLAYPLVALAESTTPPKEAAGVGGLELLSSMTETLAPVSPVIPWLVVVGVGFRFINTMDSYLKSKIDLTEKVLAGEINTTKKVLAGEIDATQKVLAGEIKVLAGEIKVLAGEINTTQKVLAGEINTTNAKIDAMKAVLDKLAGTTNKKNDPASHYPLD